MLTLGCDNMGACTLNIEPGVEVEVRDRLTDEYLTVTPRGVVREGTFQDSLFDKFDLKATAPMKTGDQGTVPAEHDHFARARGRTVVDVKAMGPFAMTYVNAADDPRGHVKP